MTVAAEPTVRRWTREEYYRMGEMGLFDGQRVELIDGEIIQMAPQKDVHAAVIGLAHTAIERAFDGGWWVRMQLPLELPNDSEPEPDVSVVRGSPRDYIGTGHPHEPLLVVEVSDTTLLFDQRVKAALYASANLQEYWIVNLVADHVEVHRDPVPDASAWRKSSYKTVRISRRGQDIAPLSAPQARVRVDDLLP